VGTVTRVVANMLTCNTLSPTATSHIGMVLLRMSVFKDHGVADTEQCLLALPCRGVALLNSAGPLQETDSPELAEPLLVPWYSGIKDGLTAVAKRVVLWFAFQRAKQPERIKEVLQMVYSSNGELAGGVSSQVKGSGFRVSEGWRVSCIVGICCVQVCFLMLPLAVMHRLSYHG